MSNLKKVIILSKKFFFTDDDESIDDNLVIIDLFSRNNIDVIIISRDGNRLNSILPREYQSKITFIDRSRKTKEKLINAKDKYFFSIVGVVNEDAVFSFNCKIPLFNSEKLSGFNNDVEDKVEKYGLPVFKFQEIVDCYSTFEYHKSDYFGLSYGNNYTVISLTNANTYYRPEEEVRIKNIFRANLKSDENNRDRRVLLLLLFKLISEISTNDFYDDIRYWGTFPSSDPQNLRTSASFIKESIRYILGGLPRNNKELLIRVDSMKSKHTSTSEYRHNIKCGSDFNTLIINPDYLEKIKGQNICIIDDYITNGYSAEAARNLLLSAGANKVVFISIGKFGREYHVADYNLKGDLSKNGYEYVFEKDTLLGEFNSKGENFYNDNNNNELLKLKDIIS
ncbi:phosphoribosyltransferase [Companilactobacillus paralimentarius]|uniref:phosphoribosyltransferase n=1 Tax=Companilactobacillus paralimentarius TaxID=83526 RepID=UPI0037E058FF